MFVSVFYLEYHSVFPRSPNRLIIKPGMLKLHGLVSKLSWKKKLDYHAIITPTHFVVTFKLNKEVNPGRYHLGTTTPSFAVYLCKLTDSNFVMKALHQLIFLWEHDSHSKNMHHKSWNRIIMTVLYDYKASTDDSSFFQFETSKILYIYSFCSWHFSGIYWHWKVTRRAVRSALLVFLCLVESFTTYLQYLCKVQSRRCSIWGTTNWLDDIERMIL